MRALVKLRPRQILWPRARRLDSRQDGGELVGVLGPEGAIQYPAQVREKGRQGPFNLPVIVGAAVGMEGHDLARRCDLGTMCGRNAG